MKVAIYGRVSTAEQSTAMQLEEMRAFCQRCQWEIVEEFTDTMTGSRAAFTDILHFSARVVITTPDPLTSARTARSVLEELRASANGR